MFEDLVGDLPKAIDQLIEEHEEEKIQYEAMGTLEDITHVGEREGLAKMLGLEQYWTKVISKESIRKNHP